MILYVLGGVNITNVYSWMHLGMNSAAGHTFTDFACIDCCILPIYSYPDTLAML